MMTHSHKLCSLAIANVFLLFLLHSSPSGCSIPDSKTGTNETKATLNVLGTPLEICSLDPVTGWFRDGFCRTDDNDHGVHVVCATMTENFLAFTKSRGNDLSSRRGGFPGLRPGDSWCLCAARWKEAMTAGAAPLVNLGATHIKALDTVALQELKVNQVAAQQIIVESQTKARVEL